MMVTFVSQCQKNSLKKTRRVLDAFADRIGDNTWQTVITEDGLIVVKKMLRQTASKNTAVACHWIRSRSRSEFLWVVGNKNQFDEVGRVPVNSTGSDIEIFQDKAQWKSLVLIQYAASLAGLFHDFGKANKLFQDKINPNVKGVVFEPYRHEWVSLRLFQAFVSGKSDKEWLNKLTDINLLNIDQCFRDGIDGNFGSNNNPFSEANLAPLAKLVAWIILTHHRLPMIPGWNKNIGLTADFSHVEQWLDKNFNAVWNSYRCHDEDQKERIIDNWTFSEGALPYSSSYWRAKACIVAAEAKQKLAPLLGDASQDFINGQLFTSHIARLCMMLADHHYSSQKNVTPEWRSPSYTFHANSDRDTKQLKQQLDEHLIGVSLHAEAIVKKLPKLRSSLISLNDNTFLGNSVPKKFKEAFGWQDKAVKAIENIAGDTKAKGFFGINMASTGKGKTIANAKIMYALGREAGGVRFSVALGLRTLTLQTGREFRDSVELSNEQLAILVGGASVKQLFENSQRDQESEKSVELSGSASDQDVLQDELYVHYSGELSNHSLHKWTKGNERLEKLLCAPVLVSTIDHLMPATEGIKGGKQIGPMLRLLTSDLVLDEPDDFGLDDLPALCRLVYWAGMLGSRVLLSTATMPPALSYALFQAYKAGWSQYALVNIDNWSGEINCAWIDEFSTVTQAVRDFKTDFKSGHDSFVTARLKNLNKNSQVKRIGKIVEVEVGEANAIDATANVCYTQLIQLHSQHHVVSDKHSVSIGLIRMANINPLVAVAKALFKLPAPENTCIHYCVYHSRFPLAIRSSIENRLDTVLSRKDENVFWNRKEITEALSQSPNIQNHIFVVLASPVAEVGRDHDYDWAIVEPSSMRSIIQLAGRVLRHRTPSEPLASPNIVLLNKNIKALKGIRPCFNRPGFEGTELQLVSHDLNSVLLSTQVIKIDAAPRISMPESIKAQSCNGHNDSVKRFFNLCDLEHSALSHQLFTGMKNAKTWWQYQPHWCGEVQRQQPFRKSEMDEAYYLYVDDIYKVPYWCWLNENVCPVTLGEVTDISINRLDDFSMAEGCHFWFNLDALDIYSQLAQDFSIDLKEVSRRFGELRVTSYQRHERTEYYYHESLGLFQEMDIDE